MNREEQIRVKVKAGLSPEQAAAVVDADEQARRQAVRDQVTYWDQRIEVAKKMFSDARQHFEDCKALGEKAAVALAELEALEAKEHAAANAPTAAQAAAAEAAAAEAAAAEAAAAEAAAAEAAAAEAAAEAPAPAPAKGKKAK